MAFSLGKNSEYLFPYFTNDFHPPWQKHSRFKMSGKKHKPHLVLCWFCFCSWFWHILELLFFLTRVEVVLQCLLVDFSVRFIPRKSEASTSIEILSIKLWHHFSSCPAWEQPVLPRLYLCIHHRHQWWSRLCLLKVQNTLLHITPLNK